MYAALFMWFQRAQDAVRYYEDRMIENASAV
jgi:hypothetical protein